MSRVGAVLGALWKAIRREQESLLKFPANNLYYAGVAFLVMLDPYVIAFVATIVGIVIFFPLSADPLRRIPDSRFLLWPLERSERWLMRVLSPWLNPMTWIVLGFALWRTVSPGLGALAAGLFLLTFAADWRPRGQGLARGWIPRLPAPLGELIRKDLRDLVHTLDFYCALVVGGAAAAYRLGGLLPAEAGLPATMLTILALSTCAQTLFGLDGPAGMTRYRLLPMRGWQILLAKDIAFLIVALLLTLALDPVAGLAAGMAALAFARKPAVQETRAQMRWRLQAGTSFGGALAQILALVAAASAAHVVSRLYLMPVAAVWAFSLWWGGRQLERPA